MKTMRIFVHAPAGTNSRSYFPQDRKAQRLCEQDGIMFQPKKSRGQWGVISFREARRGDKTAKAKVGEIGFKIIRYFALEESGECLICGRLVSSRQLTVEFDATLSDAWIDDLVGSALGEVLGIHPRIIKVNSLSEMKFK